MSLKARLKPYIFTLGLIFSLFSFSNVFAVNNPQWQCTGSGTDFSGVDYKVYYDGFDYLTIDVSFNLTPTWSSLPSNPTKALFRKYDSPYSGPFAKLNIPSYSGSSYLMGAICDTSHTVINPSGMSGEFCKVDRNETGVKLRVYGIRETGSWNLYLSNESGLTRSILDNAFGYQYLENNAKITEMPHTYVCNESTCTDVSDNYDFPNYAQSFPLGSSSPINGTCGAADGQNLTTIPPENSYACSSGTMIDFNGGINELGTGIKYFWTCDGSNGGYSETCSSALTTNVINGTCGSANGQTLSIAPYEYQKCSFGQTSGSTLQTLNGWTWSCYGFNSGTTASCSAIYQQAEVPPIIPDSSIVPTPTDCETYSGIDKIMCNLGNSIQGMFLPSASKLTELQTTMNAVGNVFPFNYLRIIGSIFSNFTITQNSLTMTLLGNTATLDNSFFSIALFPNVRLFFTIMVLLMFTFWAIGYIKHFFK